MALQPGHPIVAPNSSMSCLVILPLWIRAPSNGNGGIGIGSTRISGLSPVHLPSVILQSSSITFLTTYVFHLIYGLQSSDCPSPEYTVCTPNEIFCPVVSRFKAKSQTCITDSSFCSWELWRFALPTLSHQMGPNACDGVLPCSLSNGVFSSRPFLTSGQDTFSTVPPTTA